MQTASKSSFTLFELLIVILIISIIYGIFIEKISSKDAATKREGIEGIVKLLATFDFNQSASFVCTKECKECFIEIDGKKKESIEPFFQTIKVYDFDINGILSPIKFTPIFDKNGNPQEVCLRLSLYPNGSHSSYIVEDGDRFYVFYAYMRPPKVADTITKASELFDPSQWIPTDSSQYNF